MYTVSLTACWTAALRARETAQPEPLFTDAFASVLAGPEGEELRERLQSPGVATHLVIAIRTRFFDDEVVRLARELACEQCVLLGAGLDSRAFRLDLPAGLTLFELDRPDLLELKASRLAAAGAQPRCRRIAVGADLARDWQTPLLQAGFEGKRTLWMIEGVLPYLEAAQVHGLLQQISARAQPGDALLADVPGQSLLDSPELAPWLATLSRHGIEWKFGTDQPERLLDEHGWDARALQYGDAGANFGRWPYPTSARDDARFARSFLISASKR